MNPKTTAFLDIDTQHDFADPDGALAVPGAEAILDALAKLVAFSREKKLWLLSTADTHAPDDPEFADFPPHCVAGTEGWAKIRQTTTIPYLAVKPRAGALPPTLDRTTQVIFEKPTLDIFDNPNFAALVEREKNPLPRCLRLRHRILRPHSRAGPATARAGGRGHRRRRPRRRPRGGPRRA